MYKLHLILKYLLKRRIAWVSLIAVMLCTTMVLVVISVMGGWLNMFKSSFRGLSGDLVIHADTLSGFPYYQEILAAIEKDPDCKVEAAIPTIETAGLVNFGSGPVPVQVMGLPIAETQKVNKFAASLYRQHVQIEDELKKKDLSAEQRGRLEQLLAQAPSFDLLNQVTTPLAVLPAGLKYEQAAEGKELARGTIAMPADYPKLLKGKLRYDETRHIFIYSGGMPMPAVWKALLDKLSDDPPYTAALAQLLVESQSPDVVQYAGSAGKYHGMIVGTGVIGMRKDHSGKWIRYLPVTEYQRSVGLTVLDLSGGTIDATNTVTRNFYIVDDSHLGVWQYDQRYVYVAFDVLQRDLGMDAQKVTIDDKPSVRPARVTDIHIKVKKGVDSGDENQLQVIKVRMEQVVHDVVTEQQRLHPEFNTSNAGDPIVQTWQDTQRVWISAVENEKMLTVVLFGIMCIVAIFLIFCIFYMIVVEKTRDIGIIKSVGATSAGVAGIFLGYGLVIGILGGGMGLGLSYIIVHNINEMHSWLGRQFNVQIWDPQVYLFDKIPNTMSAQDIYWILPTAVLASVLGALIPAIRAARLHPVEALRWE